MTRVLDALASEQPSVKFAKANIDVSNALAKSVDVEEVPFVAFFNPSKERLDKFVGADPPKLVEKVAALVETYKGSFNDIAGNVADDDNLKAPEDLNARLQKLIGSSPVMVFIKGTKAQPYCGFSKQAVALLNKYNVEYNTFDILSDEDVRQGLKQFSNWPTYPQLYVKGEFQGGLDIMKEMDQDGSLKEALGVPT
eukprot:gnl/MRDRNA2_/MRDRNA2_193168_c0_seq1.p1 gnl/MRDRNA2_/MRDRNA2_193168_c0~~gnl/MRDRNA2_/MRDRNA2_193168_c0_seq1.p1  ORF type:complete len:196 (+),score=49.97 gnl/MRDRNA2_/MRDRNA2_193168_c0_seq1:126-713(+)